MPPADVLDAMAIFDMNSTSSGNTSINESSLSVQDVAGVSLTLSNCTLDSCPEGYLPDFAGVCRAVCRSNESYVPRAFRED